MAAQDSSETEQEPAGGAVNLQRFQSVRRATRMEATVAAEEGAEESLVSADQGGEQAAD
jgi:hypothetical protein